MKRKNKALAWVALIVSVAIGGLLIYMMPALGIPVCVLLFAVSIFLLIRAYEKPSEPITAAQLHDLEMQRHIAQVKNDVEKWRGDLCRLMKDRNFRNLKKNVYRCDVRFLNVLDHCPTIANQYVRFNTNTLWAHENIQAFRRLWGDIPDNEGASRAMEGERERMRGAIEGMLLMIDHSMLKQEYIQPRKCCPANTLK